MKLNELYDLLYTTLRAVNRKLPESLPMLTYGDAAKLVMEHSDEETVPKRINDQVYEAVVFSRNNTWDIVCPAAIMLFGQLNEEVARIILSAERYYLQEGKHLNFTEQDIHDLFDVHDNLVLYVLQKAFQKALILIDIKATTKFVWDESIDRDIQRVSI